MKFHMYDVYGIEAEYMIVDKSTLNVLALSPFVLSQYSKTGIEDEVEVGAVAWSNELVSHVIEIKTNGPTKDPIQARQNFFESLQLIQAILDKKDATLLPTSMHPWMNPDKETQLWPHGQKEVYQAYDRIFNCKGHGWSNLQSVHLNLPFYNEAEFASLHAAMRIILPLVPFLSASSPFVDSKLQEIPDTRLSFYEANQKKIPAIAGEIIPEPIFSFKDYDLLYQSIYQEIAPFDPDKILQHPWLNSRGVIAKFDVGALELRLMDIQESPFMDFTILEILILILQDLSKEVHIPLENQKTVSTAFLKSCLYSANLFDAVLNGAYMELLGFENRPTNLFSFCEQVLSKYRLSAQSYEGLKVLRDEGRLAERLRKSYRNSSQDPNALKSIYSHLAFCLQKNIFFSSKDV